MFGLATLLAHCADVGKRSGGHSPFRGRSAARTLFAETASRRWTRPVPSPPAHTQPGRHPPHTPSPALRGPPPYTPAGGGEGCRLRDSMRWRLGNSMSISACRATFATAVLASNAHASTPGSDGTPVKARTEEPGQQVVLQQAAQQICTAPQAEVSSVGGVTSCGSTPLT